MLKNLLILDDDTGVRTLFQQIFKGKGFTVYDTANSEEALELCKKERMHIIFLDYNLKKGIGWDIIKTIQENPALYGKPKIIAMSGTIGSDSVKEKQYNYDLFLEKPFDLPTLLDEVKKFLPEKSED